MYEILSVQQLGSDCGYNEKIRREEFVVANQTSTESQKNKKTVNVVVKGSNLAEECSESWLPTYK